MSRPDTYRPRWVIRRNVKHASHQRYGYDWNEWRYPMSDIKVCWSPDGYSRTLLGALVAVHMIPIRKAIRRAIDRIYRDKEWSL